MKGIIFAAILPGPKTGQTLCTEAIFKRAGQLFNPEGIIHFPIVANWSKNKIISALVKVITTLTTAIRLWFSPVTGIYYCPNARWGKLMDILFFIAAPRNRNYFLHHHSGGYIKKPTFLSRIVFALLPAKTNHITSCEFFSSALKKNYGVLGKTFELPCSHMCHPIPCDFSVHSSVDCGNLGHLSNLTVEKGIEELVETAKQIKTVDTVCKIVIAGPDEDNRITPLKELCRKESLPVEWLGPVYDSDKDAFYSGLSLFLFPSKYHDETWGIVVSEARSRGIPCLVSDLPGVRDQVASEFIWSADQDDKTFGEFVKQHLLAFFNDKDKYVATRSSVLKEFEEEYVEAHKQLDKVLETIHENEWIPST